MSREKVIKQLKKLTCAENVYLTKRCNSSILYALRACKNLGSQTVLIPEDGGWITYLQFPDRLHMNLVKVKTNSAKIDLIDLEEKLKENPSSVLICHSLAGYFVELPVAEIYNLCKKYSAFFINDVCGSIGTDIAKIENSDIVVGSFGRWKPINLGSGGFIAFNDNKFFHAEIEENELDYELLLDKLKNIDKRLKFLRKICDSVKTDLAEYDIIHPESKSLCVVIRFTDEKMQRRITSYADSKELSYTICPRYIRVNEDAVSIEVKRLD